MNHSELQFQSGLNGVAHVVKELQAMAKEALRQAAILQSNFELIYEADEVRAEQRADGMNDGEFALLEHIHPELINVQWTKHLDKAECGCDITRYVGKDVTGEKDDLIVVVKSDGYRAVVVEPEIAR